MIAIERGSPSRQALVACADVANRALATDDLELALRARGIELYFATRLDLERHAITVAAEAIVLWEQLEQQPELADDVRGHMLYLLSSGCLVAMSKIDVPLATCHELVATLRRVLDRFGSHHIQLWEVEAALAHLEGDRELVRDRIERIGPLLGWRSREHLGAGCPGCILLAFVQYLGPDPDPDHVEALVRPYLRGEPFPHDAAHAFTATDRCHTFERSANLQLALAYARHGRLAEAKLAQRVLMRDADPNEAGDWLSIQHARLEIAIADRDLPLVRELVVTVRALVAKAASPYSILAEHKAFHAAHLVLGEVDRLPAAHAAAIAIARQWDARLATPRHVAETELALARQRA